MLHGGQLNMIYKMMLGITAAALAAGIGLTVVQAQENPESTAVQTTQLSRYVDEDGDGICDNRANGQCGSAYVDENGDGICDNRGNSQCGGSFVDENGDGICDNAGSGLGAQRGRSCFGQGRRAAQTQNN
jgi:hypothetical protein